MLILGRQRKEEDEKKVPISLKIKKSLLDELRIELEKREIPITHFFENAIKDFLKK